MRADGQRARRTPHSDQKVRFGQCAGEMVVAHACLGEAVKASVLVAARSHRDGQGLRMSEPFESTNQFIDHIAETLFDTLGQRLLGSLLVFTHALRLEFSMGSRMGESTVWRRFGNSRTDVCD
jgi:hypothetical protein